MNILTWNVEWASTRSWRGKEIQRLIHEQTPVVTCLTELTLGILPATGHLLPANGNSGYPGPADRKKVALWSTEPWTELDQVGHPDMPGGRFVTGITHGIRFVGVCIPWHNAHVTTGRRDRSLWEDHLQYLDYLKSLLAQYAADSTPICLLGDFNQRVPKGWQPDEVYERLLATLHDRVSLPTAEVTDAEGNQLIDHIAHSADLRFRLSQIIPKRTGDDRKLSDHVGISGELLTSG